MASRWPRGRQDTLTNSFTNTFTCPVSLSQFNIWFGRRGHLCPHVELCQLMSRQAEGCSVDVKIASLGFIFTDLASLLQSRRIHYGSACFHMLRTSPHDEYNDNVWCRCASKATLETELICCRL